MGCVEPGPPIVPKRVSPTVSGTVRKCGTRRRGQSAKRHPAHHARKLYVLRLLSHVGLSSQGDDANLSREGFPSCSYRPRALLFRASQHVRCNTQSMREEVQNTVAVRLAARPARTLP